MASIIPGYEYDIFISYRQKDNRHDGWVTDFVENLKGQLESAFKEDISVYFDVNPHDGLLETHDVGASLKDKLKCLVFIPVISRTFCDPRSFAWEHEFKAFVEQASGDRLGLKVKLPKGNVTSRVLPVIIHDLEKEDIQLCESVLGGVLRGVEFVYKSPGVNRPLRSTEDKPHDNLNKTIYLDQINKVANAVKEIISSLSTDPNVSDKEKSKYPDKATEVKNGGIKKKRLKAPGFKRKLVTGMMILLAVVAIFIAYSFLTKRAGSGNSSEEILEKGIAYSDFEHSWDNYYGKIMMRTVFEDGSHGDEILEIQTGENAYRRSYSSGDRKFTEGIRGGKCFIETGGDKNPQEVEVPEQNPECNEIRFFKEHHYCHFGLLMELKNSGMVLQNKVEKVKFNGNTSLALTFVNDTTKAKNSYFSNISSIIVYFDPTNYSMKGYKRFGKLDLYCEFSGELNVNGIKIPLSRTYFNSNDNTLKWIDVFSVAE